MGIHYEKEPGHHVPKYKRDIQAAVQLVHMFYEAGVQGKNERVQKEWWKNTMKVKEIRKEMPRENKDGNSPHLTA